MCQETQTNRQSIESLSALRKELGLTQIELGKAIGISHDAIYAYEKGLRIPSAATLLDLAEYLKVQPRKLFDAICRIHEKEKACANLNNGQHFIYNNKESDPI